MTVAFKELTGSPKENYGPNGMTAERHLICAWQDRNSFVEEILGEGCQFGISNPVSYPGASGVLAAQVAVEPLTDDMVKQNLASLTEGLNAYQGFAKVTIKYETSLV
jgi:hypothetical protein